MSNPKKKIFYISLIEDPINNGIIKSQAINVLKAAAAAGHEAVFFSSPSKKLFSRHNHSEIEAFRIDLESNGIKFYCTPLPIISNACIRAPLIPFLLAFELPIVLLRLVKEQPDIIHCRSYPASLVGLIAKTILNKKLIFDMRGVYPEEGNFLFPNWHIKSINFRTWKKIEQLLLQFSEKIIVVSEEFKRHINSTTNNKISPQKLSTIICGTPEVLESTDFQRTIASPLKIVYSGTIDGWTSPKLIAEIYKKILDSNFGLDIHLNIYTTTPPEKIIPAFDLKGISKNQYTISTLSSKDVPKKLADNDLSLLVREDSIVNSVSFPVKISEYIAAGLPILTNAHIKGGQEFIIKSKTGVSLESVNFDLTELTRNIIFYRDNCKKTISTLNETAANYLKIYAEL